MIKCKELELSAKQLLLDVIFFDKRGHENCTTVKEVALFAPTGLVLTETPIGTVGWTYQGVSLELDVIPGQLDLEIDIKNAHPS